MGLATINSQYNGLNGLSAGLGGYYGGGIGYNGALYSDSYVDTAKKSIANGYEVSATSNSYANKANISSSSYAQQCQAIEYLLQSGRTDDAMEKYNNLYQDMASNAYYQGYSENEIKTLLQEQYVNATGTTIVNDITTNAGGSFGTALGSSIPLFGLLNQDNSSDDFVAKATGTKTSKADAVAKVAGVTAGVVASGATAYGVSKLAGLAKNSKGILKVLGKNPKVAAIAAGITALGTYIVGKFVKNSN